MQKALQKAGQKSITGHIWMMVVAAAIQFTILLSVFAILYKYPNAFRRTSTLRLILPFVWFIMVLGEIVVYWRLRYQIYKRLPAWLHAIILTASFILPIVLPPVMAYCVDAWGLFTNRTMEAMFRILPYLFWSLLIISHYFFFLVIINRNKAHTPLVSSAKDDLLPEFEV